MIKFLILEYSDGTHKVFIYLTKHFEVRITRKYTIAEPKKI